MAKTTIRKEDVNMMRDRLIELLNKKYDHFCDQCGVNKDSHYTESLADYLLENGVIAPPCKVGDVVYWFNMGNKLMEAKVAQQGFVAKLTKDGFEYGLPYDKIGKTVFLTKEEAEAKLKEGASDGNL